MKMLQIFSLNSHRYVNASNYASNSHSYQVAHIRNTIKCKQERRENTEKKLRRHYNSNIIYDPVLAPVQENPFKILGKVAILR